MKLIIDKESLLFAVQIVQRAVSFKSPLPVLSGIKFSTYTDNLSDSVQLALSATDLEMSIQCILAAEIEELGSIILPARHIVELIRHLPNIPVILETSDGGAVLKYDRSEIFLNGFLVEEFPSLSFSTENPIVIVKGDSLKEIIRQVIFAVAKDENRPLFSGVLFMIKEDELEMVATDTHRLAWRRLRIEERIKESEVRGEADLPEGNGLSVIIPAKALLELSKIIDSTEESVRVCLTQNTIVFSTSYTCLTTRLLQGQYPDYQSVIPKEQETKVRLCTRKITESVERASLLTSDSSPVIKVSIDNNSMLISANSSAGYVNEEIPVSVEGPPVKIAFNVRYLSDILKVIDSKEVFIEFGGPLVPTLIRPSTSENYLTLLMPIKL
ncbi:MAG: DNA polymerase III subunit beta [Peptococcaceae bacterium]|nr:MAG: DNA polymerase III subunit beta [Peptococcaceae bacterium]